jgi:hypothetical protein
VWRQRKIKKALSLAFRHGQSVVYIWSDLLCMNDPLHWFCVYQLSIDTKERKKISFVLLVFSLKTAGSKRLTVALPYTSLLIILLTPGFFFFLVCRHTNQWWILFSTLHRLDTIEQHSRNRPLFFPQYLLCLDPISILFERP